MTLNEKINRIAKTVDELASVIEYKYNVDDGYLDENCIGFEDYPGLVGELGDGVGKSLTTIFAYKTGSKPEIPVGGKFEPLLGSIEYPDGWSNNANTEESDTTVAVWQSHAIFDATGNQIVPGTAPVRITGLDGQDGQDYEGPSGEGGSGGDGSGGGSTVGKFGIEFIYKRFIDEDVSYEIPDSVQEDGDIPEGWERFPQGVTDVYQVERVSQRIKDEEGVGSAWSNPTIGAMYGKIGRDGNGVEYIFCLTKDEKTTPELPTMDPFKDESAYEGQGPLKKGDFSWYDNPQDVSKTNTICWVSMRRQLYDSEGLQRGSSLSKPSIGSRFSKDGKDGKEGGGRTLFVYTGSAEFNPNPAIKKPTGGYWDIETNELKDVKSQDNYQGTIYPPERSETVKYIWQSNGSFHSSGNLIGEWSDPFCITGEQGIDGADGVNVEFIYRLLVNDKQLEELRKYLKQFPLEDSATNTPPKTEDDICDTKGTDEPSGIDGENYLIEVACTRKKEASGGGKGSDPVIGAKGGEDGNDGPGVEYIFLVTSDKHDGENGSEDMTSDVVLNLYMPDINEMMTHEKYKYYGFVPNDSFGYAGYDGTDEPSDVGPDEPYEGVSIRKGQVDQVTGKVAGGPFDKPKLWAKYTHDGYAYRTSYVFCASDIDPEQPKYGDGDHPYPLIEKTEGSITIGDKKYDQDPNGHDTVPESNGKVIGMSSRTFRSDNKSFDDDWSKPKKMIDTSSFQVEFTTEDLSKKPGYTPDNFGKYYKDGVSPDDAEKAWREAEEAKGVKWEDDVPDALYMATAVCHNGKGNNGAVVKIKGEKGDAGENGTSVKFKGSFANLDALKQAWENYKSDPTTAFNGSLEIGDGFILEQETSDGYNFYTYTGGYDADNVTFENCWKGFNIKGEKGDSAILYIRYSDDGGSTFTGNNGLVPGKYIGTLIENYELDEDTVNNVNSYDGYQWHGEDGGGYEQIFVLSNEDYNLENPPHIPTDNKQVPEYLPPIDDEKLNGTAGSDTPISPTKQYPYCGMVTRTRQGDKFGDWKGEGEHAILYSRFAYDGSAPHHLELSQDQVVIPMDGENGVDADFIKACEETPLKITMALWKGDDVVENGVIYSVRSEAAIVEDNNITLDVTKLANTAKITCQANYNGKDFTKELHIHKTNVAYELSVNKSVLRRDPYNENKLISDDSTIIAEVKKWNGTKGTRPGDNLVSATIFNIEGDKVSIEFSDVDWREYKATFDLSEYKDIAKVRLEIDGTEIFEEIGVIANGEDGITQEYIYTRFNTELTDEEKAQYNPTPEDINSDDYQKSNYKPIEGAITGTDDAIGVDSDYKYEYVSSRKKKNGKWDKFSNLALGAVYSEQGAPGQQGPAGIQVQLSNPASILQLIEGQLYSNAVYSNVEVRQGNIIIPITKVEIHETRVSDSASMPDITLVSENANNGGKKLTFSVSIVPVEQTIEIDLYIYTEENFYMETKTIVVQKSGGENAIHLELTNDSISANTNIDGSVSQAILYSGGVKLSDVTYSCEDNTYGITVDNNGYIYYDQTNITEIVHVTIIANYGELSPYEKTINIIPGNDNYNLIVTPNMVNAYDPVCSIECTKNGEGIDLHDYTVKIENTSLNNFTDVDLTEYIDDSITALSIKLYDNTDALLDSESIGVYRDPEYYQIQATETWIVKDSSGVVITPRDTIDYKIILHRGSDTENATLPENYYVTYSIDGGSENNYSVPINPSSVDTQLKFFLYDGEATYGIDYAEVDVINQEKGDPGTSSSSPIIYSAGEGAPEGSYTGNASTAPYVSVTGSDSISYYIAYGTPRDVPGGSTTITGNTKLDWNNPTDRWVEMEEFNAIYSNIGLFGSALVGPAVFHKNYVYSQQGSDGFAYQDFTIPSEGSMPNICFDFNTGETWLAGGKIHLTGEESTIAGWTIGENALSNNGLSISTTDGISYKSGQITYYRLGLDGTASFCNDDVKFGKSGASFCNESVKFTEDTASFCNGDVKFETDGTFNLCNKITYDSRNVKIGGLTVAENGLTYTDSNNKEHNLLKKIGDDITMETPGFCFKSDGTGYIGFSEAPVLSGNGVKAGFGNAMSIDYITDDHIYDIRLPGITIQGNIPMQDNGGESKSFVTITADQFTSNDVTASTIEATHITASTISVDAIDNDLLNNLISTYDIESISDNDFYTIVNDYPIGKYMYVRNDHNFSGNDFQISASKTISFGPYQGILMKKIADLTGSIIF